MILEGYREDVQLKGIRFAETTSGVFPPQYAYSSSLDQMIGDVRGVRDSLKFESAYRTAWTVLCMQYDRPEQVQALAVLKADLSTTVSVSGQQDRIAQYWDELADVSIYPVYDRVRNQLRADAYPQKVVNSWNPSDWNVPNYQDTQYALAGQIYPHIYEREVARRTFGGHSESRKINIARFDDQIRSEGNPDLLSYVTALRVLNSSRSIPHEVILGRIDQLDQVYQGKLSVTVPDREQMILALLKRLEPYHRLSQVLSRAIQDKELEMFGENTELASELWHTAVFLRYSKLPQSVGHGDIRSPLVSMLIDADYPKATYYIEDLMAQYPGVIPDFVKDTLDIDPTYLRQLYAEEETKRAEEALDLIVTHNFREPLTES